MAIHIQNQSLFLHEQPITAIVSYRPLSYLLALQSWCLLASCFCGWSHQNRSLHTHKHTHKWHLGMKRLWSGRLGNSGKEVSKSDQDDKEVEKQGMRGLKMTPSFLGERSFVQAIPVATRLWVVSQEWDLNPPVSYAGAAVSCLKLAEFWTHQLWAVLYQEPFLVSWNYATCSWTQHIVL